MQNDLTLYGYFKSNSKEFRVNNATLTIPPGSTLEVIPLAAGKQKMVIRIALARKLLVRLNAKARDARAVYANAT